MLPTASTTVIVPTVGPIVQTALFNDAVCTTADVNRTNNAVIAYVSVVSLLVPVRTLPVGIGKEML